MTRLLFIPMLFASYIGIGQSIVQEKKISFFSNNLLDITSSDLSNFENKIKTNSTIKYSDLHELYFEISDDYISTTDPYYGIFLYNKRKPKGNPLLSKVVPQLFNDSLLYCLDGKIMNINNGQFLNYSFQKNQFPIELKTEQRAGNIEQIESRSRGKIIMTDIFRQKFDQVYDDVIVNILSDNILFQRGMGYDVINNPTSKYIMYAGGLMNRFNVKDTLNVPYFSYSMSIYNDSIIYYALPISTSYKLLDYKYNEKIDLEFSSDLLRENEKDLFMQKRRTLYDSDAMNYATGVTYFHKKINKKDVSMSSITDFNNYFHTYDNLIGNDLKSYRHNGVYPSPSLIIEYNFINKKITSILDKSLFPITGVTNMFLDKGNKYLLVQQHNKTFTVFNLNTKKEIITLPGIINDVNNKNELILNVVGLKSNSYGGSESFQSIELTKLNLNELYSISDSFYVRERMSSMNVDEFTTKNEFDIKRKFLESIEYRKLLVSTKSNNYNTNNVVYNKYSNDFVQKSLNNLTVKYLDILFKSNNEFSPFLNRKNEISYKLNYLSYSNENKSLEFKTDKLNQMEMNLFSYYNQSNNYQIRFSEQYDNTYLVYFRNIDLNEAKIMKDQSSIVIKSNFQNFFKLPDMSNFIVLKYFDSIYKKLYYYYEGMTDTSSSDKFYRNFVPVNGRIHEIYDTWYLRVNNQDKLIYGPQ